MNYDFSKEFLKPDYIRIYVNQSVEEKEEAPFNKNLTWNVTSFQNQTLNISISFDDPTQISIGKSLDIVIFEPLNASEIF